jgi:hypothetical protein
MFAVGLALAGATLAIAQQSANHLGAAPPRPQGPCDIYAAAGDACVAAHSTTRALYASYNGPLYQVMRQSDGKKLDIGVVQPVASPVPDAGGYADAPAQDSFCANTYCWITTIYDQSPKHNDLTQAPRGGFGGPALGGFDNLPIADMAPISIMGHKVYGVFIEPGMGLRHDDARGTAVDDQAEGQYWVVDGKHFNAGCCFDYGNAEIDSRDDDNGTMETLYFGNGGWNKESPRIMTDQENNLLGCVGPDGSKACANDLPGIPWRFVTGMVKAGPHRWETMGGDAQRGPLSVMFDGPRVNLTYDPMRKQGGILLGTGGDNSDGSQGTFFEGAMTSAGTFPSNNTDQKVQSNILSARYDMAPLSVAPTFETFAPGSSHDATITFTNTGSAPAAGVTLSLGMPGKQWKSVIAGTNGMSKKFDAPVAPGASVSATFTVTSGPAPFNGDLVARAAWTDAASGRRQEEASVEKVRNASPIKINEFRVRSGNPSNPTNAFIELYNAGSRSIDLSNWTLTEHPARQAIFSAITIPAGTKLAAGGFYLLGLSDSGLAVPAHAGDSVIPVRNTDGMSVGDTISIGDGSDAETRTIASLGTSASNPTTLWQPLPDGQVITIPAGSTDVPVESTAGFVVGQKIGLGYGATYPAAANSVERYEIATVTAVGTPGTQAYLAMDAPAGATNLQVTSLSNISAGDRIRLDIDSVGHGIETVTVTHAGTAASQTNLSAPASAGATRVSIRRAEGFAAGETITIGTPSSREAVTVTAVSRAGRDGAAIDFTPALARPHVVNEWVVAPGTGLDLASPLKFNHAANLPFSDRGTGISFQPATAFAHSSNEPVQALGSGIAIDRPLASDHAIYAVVRDAAVKTAGYQGAAPNQWFGGPELTTTTPQFDRDLTIEEGSMVLRDATGVVADSLNYGWLVDPWAAEGDQAVSAGRLSGCYAPAPGSVFDPWSTVVSPIATNISAGRFSDGADTGSNCTDFRTQAAAILSAASPAGADNIKVTSVEDFRAGQTILIDSGMNRETATIATVGTPGASTLRAATEAGATILPVTSGTGFGRSESITIDSGENAETAVVVFARNNGAAALVLAAPLVHAHAPGVQASGTGISITTALTRAHAVGAQVSNGIPTPGAPNEFSGKSE